MKWMQAASWAPGVPSSEGINLGGEGLGFWGVGGAQIGERGVRDFRRSRVLLLGGNFRQGGGAEGAEQE